MTYVIRSLVWEPDTMMGVRVGPPRLVGINLLDGYVGHSMDHVLNCVRCAGGGDTRFCTNADSRIEAILDAVFGRRDSRSVGQ